MWPLVVVVSITAVVLVAVTVSAVRSARRAREGVPREPVSYRHTYRLFGVVGVALLLAFVARCSAVPDDFGRYGAYRGGAPADARDRAPRYQGKKACGECHEEELAEHDRDVHLTVQCEDCHGPGDKHIEDPPNVAVNVHKAKEWCLVCHSKLNARPGAFPQVTWREHYKFVGVKDEKVECISCHDPHRPLFLSKPVADARLHPLIHRCRDCHIGRTDSTLQRPPEHPAIFECSYCHTERAKDFATRTHKAIGCTTCHLFIKQSDFAGRIVRNDDPRFCLLCHRSADFRAPEGPPTIEWPAHAKQWDDTLDDRAKCTACHADSIHGEIARKEP